MQGGTDYVHGVFDTQTYTIYVNSDDPPSMRLSCLLHELMHVLEALYEIKISHKDLNIVGDAYAQIFIDNFLTTTKTTRKKKR